MELPLFYCVANKTTYLLYPFKIPRDEFRTNNKTSSRSGVAGKVVSILSTACDPFTSDWNIMR